jgi:lysophospholipase L1-like esterase
MLDPPACYGTLLLLKVLEFKPPMAMSISEFQTYIQSFFKGEKELTLVCAGDSTTEGIDTLDEDGARIGRVVGSANTLRGNILAANPTVATTALPGEPSGIYTTKPSPLDRGHPDRHRSPNAYPALVQAWLRDKRQKGTITVKNAGYAGKTMKWLDRYFDEAVIQKYGVPDVLVIQAGLNEITLEYNITDEYETALRSLVAKMRAYNNNGLIALMTPDYIYSSAGRDDTGVGTGNDNTYVVAEVIPTIYKMADELGLYVIDQHQEQLEFYHRNKQGRTMDLDQDGGLHYRNAGHQVKAGILLKHLLPNVLEYTGGELNVGPTHPAMNYPLPTSGTLTRPPITGIDPANVATYPKGYSRMGTHYYLTIQDILFRERVDAGIGDNDQYVGSATTYAGLPATSTDKTWALLTAQDGTNAPGGYVWLGGSYRYAFALNLAPRPLYELWVYVAKPCSLYYIADDLGYSADSSPTDAEAPKIELYANGNIITPHKAVDVPSGYLDDAAQRADRERPQEISWNVPMGLIKLVYKTPASLKLGVSDFLSLGWFQFTDEAPHLRDRLYLGGATADSTFMAPVGCDFADGVPRSIAVANTTGFWGFVDRHPRAAVMQGIRNSFTILKFRGTLSPGMGLLLTGGYHIGNSGTFTDGINGAGLVLMCLSDTSWGLYDYRPRDNTLVLGRKFDGTTNSTGTLTAGEKNLTIVLDRPAVTNAHMVKVSVFEGDGITGTPALEYQENSDSNDRIAPPAGYLGLLIDNRATGNITGTPGTANKVYTANLKQLNGLRRVPAGG